MAYINTIVAASEKSCKASVPPTAQHQRNDCITYTNERTHSLSLSSFCRMIDRWHDWWSIVHSWIANAIRVLKIDWQIYLQLEWGCWRWVCSSEWLLCFWKLSEECQQRRHQQPTIEMVGKRTSKRRVPTTSHNPSPIFQAICFAIWFLLAVWH